MALELLALVKHDCPVCDQLLPALDAGAARGSCRSPRRRRPPSRPRGSGSRVPELDDGARALGALDPEAVPAVSCSRTATSATASRACTATGSPSCCRAARGRRRRAARAAAGVRVAHPRARRSPPRLAARRARREGRIVARELSRSARSRTRSRRCTTRGLTDGLPVVPPTPERVVRDARAHARAPAGRRRRRAALRRRGDGREGRHQRGDGRLRGPSCCRSCSPPSRPPAGADFASTGWWRRRAPPGPVVVVSGPFAADAGMNADGNALGQGNRANSTIGRALQLDVRNLGGGGPRREDRAAHGRPGKVGMRSPSGSTRPRPGPARPGRAACRDSETGVTVFAGEAPRLIIDQLARDAEALAASLALALESVAHPQRGSRSTPCSWSGPSTARSSARPAGRVPARARSCSRRTHRPAARARARRGRDRRGLPRGASPTRAPVPKFAAPSGSSSPTRAATPACSRHGLRRVGGRRDRLAAAGRERGAVANLTTILDPTAEHDAVERPLAAARRARRRRSRCSTSASRAATSSSTSSSGCCASAASRSCARQADVHQAGARRPAARDRRALRRGHRGARRLRLLRVVRSARRARASRGWTARGAGGLVGVRRRRRGPGGAARPAGARARARPASDPGPHRRRAAGDRARRGRRALGIHRLTPVRSPACSLPVRLPAPPSSDAEELRANARAAEAAGFDVFHSFDHVTAALLAPLAPLTAAAAETTTRSASARSSSTTTSTTRCSSPRRSRASTGSRAGGSSSASAPVTPSPSTRRSGPRSTPPPVRKARLAEAVEVLRRLLAGEAVDLAGEHYRLEARGAAAAQERLPILVGVNGRAALAHAARHADAIGLPCWAARSPDGQRHEVRWEAERLDATVADIRARRARGPDGRSSSTRSSRCRRDRRPPRRGRGPRCADPRGSPSSTRSPRRSSPWARTTRSPRTCAVPERWGITYFSVRDIDAFAPVIERLRA